jgi:uncharacterized protein YybS (DUF2232 family)
MLPETFKDLGEIILGFILGLIGEIVAVKFYNKIDPGKSSNLKLFIVVVVQLLGMFYLLDILKELFGKDTYSTTGVLSSQIFIFDYVLKRLYPRSYLSGM